MGQYCRYCDHRCFVPDPLKSGWLLATCTQGMAHDRREVGYDITQARAIVHSWQNGQTCLTAKQLDALPERAIVVDEEGQAYQKHGREAWAFWYSANERVHTAQRAWTSLGLAHDFDGLRLLWLPNPQLAAASDA